MFFLSKACNFYPLDFRIGLPYTRQTDGHGHTPGYYIERTHNMAKHPHRLLLNQKKTWRCTLPGCRYFIHIGLAHILPGQQSICWECGSEFELDDEALSDEEGMPKCASCRHKLAGGPPLEFITNQINVKMALVKYGYTSTKQLTPQQRSTLVNIMGLDVDNYVNPEDVVEEMDKPESEDV